MLDRRSDASWSEYLEALEPLFERQLEIAAEQLALLRAVAPDAVVLDAVAPDAVVLDAVAPDAVMLDAAAPDAVAPDAVMLDAAAPDAVVPGAVTPDVAVPGVVAPERWTADPAGAVVASSSAAATEASTVGALAPSVDRPAALGAAPLVAHVRESRRALTVEHPVARSPARHDDRQKGAHEAPAPPAPVVAHPLGLAPGAAEASELLRVLRPGGAAPPLFFSSFLCGVYPSPMKPGIADMVPHLAADRPVFGLHPPPLAPELVGAELTTAETWAGGRARIDELAALAADLIAARTHGDAFFLAGFCSGTRLVLELARQLAARGRGPRGVMLVNPTLGLAEEPDGLRARLEPQIAAIVWYLTHDVVPHAGWDPFALYDELAAMPSERRWPAVHARLVSEGHLAPRSSLAALRSAYEMEQRDLVVLRQTLERCPPRPYGGPVTVLFAEQLRDYCSAERLREVEAHLRTYLTGAVQLGFVGGLHGDPLVEPHLRGLAQTLEHAMAGRGPRQAHESQESR